MTNIDDNTCCQCGRTLTSSLTGSQRVSDEAIVLHEHGILAQHWLERFVDREMTYFLYLEGEDNDPKYARLAYDRYMHHASLLTDDSRNHVAWRADMTLRERHGDSYEVFKTIGVQFLKQPICQAAIKRRFCSLAVLQVGSAPDSDDWNLCLLTAARALESCEDEVPAVVIDALRLSDNKTFGYVARCVAEYVTKQCPAWDEMYARALATPLRERE